MKYVNSSGVNSLTFQSVIKITVGRLSPLLFALLSPPYFTSTYWNIKISAAHYYVTIFKTLQSPCFCVTLFQPLFVPPSSFSSSQYSEFQFRGLLWHHIKFTTNTGYRGLEKASEIPLLKVVGSRRSIIF